MDENRRSIRSGSLFDGWVVSDNITYLSNVSIIAGSASGQINVERDESK